MPGKDRGLVGIELCRDELRAVYVRRHGARPEVAAAAFVRMPEGGLAAGVVEHPNIVAIALKRLLEEMRVPNGVGAVMGVPSEGITVRTLSVPPAPDEELATIVAGEVEHYRILRTKGSHAFVALTPPVKGTQATPISVVVAAAEEQVTRSLGELASQGGIEIAALEPVEFGQLRSAASAIGQDQTAFAILVGDISTDLAAFSKGQLWFYRRVEYGARQLVPSSKDTTPIHPFGDDIALLPTSQEATQKYSESMVEALASEINRSIEYLSREYKEHAQFSRLHVAVGEALLSDIATPLGEQISLPIEVLPPSGGFVVASDGASRLSGPEGLRYGAAFGLAIREQLTVSGALPRVDLYASERSAFAGQMVRRNLTGSVVASVVAIGAAVAGYFLYGSQTAVLNADMDRAKAHTAELTTEADAMTAKHQARSKQIDVLSNDAAPAIPLMDMIATSLDQGVGIQSLTVNPDRTVTITAEAVDAASMLHTVENIQRIPILQNVMVQTFNTKNEHLAGVAFTVAAKTLPLSSVRTIPAPQVSTGSPVAAVGSKPSQGGAR